MNDKLWKNLHYFQKSEFEPNADKNAVNLVFGLDDLREKAGVPIFVNQAYAIGGHSEKSFHYIGMAADIHFDDSLNLCEQAALVLMSTFNGIGFYPFWNQPGWHVDCRPKRLCWVQDKDGNYHYGAKQLARALRFYV